MKIGDKVRFLSEKGGGRVAGFQGKNIVLVEDEDGFEIPFPIHEVVVVNQEDYSTKHVVEKKQQTSGEDKRSIKERLADNEITEENDTDPSDNFVAPVMERKGGDKLSVYLAFVPVNIKEFTTTRFEAYIVNDSNYYLYYTYLVGENNSWTLHHSGEVEPNTKEFLEDFGREQLNDMSHVAIQFVAYKREKTFLIKPAIGVDYRLDAVKFYKLHSFSENDFFEMPAQLYTIIENDVIKSPIAVNKELFFSSINAEEKVSSQQEMKSAARKNDQGRSRPVRQRLKDDKIIVDLHANALLETTAGMNAGDILDYQLGVFRQTLDQYNNKKGQKIIFIHGKGEGVLRQSIIHELNYKYKQHAYQDASFQEYGYGATQVTIK